jgi:tetratricopeptide (TPR) repeat protein
VSGGSARIAFDLAGEGRNAWIRFESARGRGRVFVPRDSFATEMGIFFNETFAQVDWIGGTSRLHLEAIEEEKPDLVVWQIAERRLLSLPLDHQAATAYEIYAFDRASPAGKLAMAAFGYRMEGALAQALDCARAAAAEAGNEPAYHYALADLLVAMARNDEAETAIRRAIEIRDDRPAYWHLASRLRRMKGDVLGALDASGRAVRLFGDNGAFVADHGYNLLAMGRPAEAVDAMEPARRDISDCLQLSHWLAHAYLAVNDVASARREAVNAYLLHPDHPGNYSLMSAVDAAPSASAPPS